MVVLLLSAAEICFYFQKKYIFQNVSGLALQLAAKCFQSGKADCLGLIILQNGQVRGSQVDSFRQYARTDLSFCHHDVKFDSYHMHSLLSDSITISGIIS